jgi:hypothetical protein
MSSAEDLRAQTSRLLDAIAEETAKASCMRESVSEIREHLEYFLVDNSGKTPEELENKSLQRDRERVLKSMRRSEG